MSESVLEMKNIKKHFSGIYAVKGAALHLEKGEIHALLGENGAGKTTLMNVLGGVLQADEGEVILNGGPVKFLSPKESQNQGIAFIHQELNIINDLMVYENLFLGTELMTKWRKLDTRAMYDKTREILKTMQVTLDPKTMVRDLDASYKQIVEIAKALLINAKIIIMDEPTTSLTNVEIEHLFEVMRTLKQNGVSIIFISHKLKEVVTICDAYTVLRDGEVVANGKFGAGEKTVSVADLAKYMVGRDVMSADIYRQHELGEVILETKNLSCLSEFKDINFKLKRGEIAGFTGLLGDGRSELAQCIFGCKKNYTGEIRIKGKLRRINNPGRALQLGIGYVPRNRKENGIIKDLSIMENITLVMLKKYTKLLWLNHKKEKADCADEVKKLNIKISRLGNLITSLSGGNQQKVVLAKWLEAAPEILIFDNPTQGVDVGAKNEIYSIIMSLAEQGVGIIVMSSEPQEIFRICDRVYVMFHGDIRGILEREEITEENIMLLSTGSNLS